MTQPTDRPGIEDLTSDRLDQLYDELWHLRLAQAGADLALQAACRMTDEQRARADRHEATLTAVRALTQRMHDWDGERPAVGRWVTELRAVLDEHGQTTA